MKGSGWPINNGATRRYARLLGAIYVPLQRALGPEGSEPLCQICNLICQRLKFQLRQLLVLLQIHLEFMESLRPSRPSGYRTPNIPTKNTSMTSVNRVQPQEACLLFLPVLL